MTNYNKLKAILFDMFEIDKADLDFGIYRIMNQKRDAVMDFINNKLPKDIKDILSQTSSVDKIKVETEMNDLAKVLESAGIVKESAPKYIALKDKLNQATDINSLEQEIFSHLASFFKRYYQEGDFISQRRYKKDVYAIPYEGEEVKLHWANADQYYIKTSEYLKNYAFILKDGKKVHFQLKEANTEQNNNKAQGNEERRFALYTELPYEEVAGDLYINFTYEPHSKSVKQTDLIKEALDYFNDNPLLSFTGLYDKLPTDKNKNRTVLEKNLTDFVARNTFDYFIHKDLSGFLNRELDFYIKNEVLYIDDIDTENPEYFVAQLSKIKALKSVAQKIIAFLAQVENFQKKLWLKKKFVIRTDWCITLDRIPESYYEDIFANKEQLDEWKQLFDVDVLNVEQLHLEPFLVLDTKYFSEEFKDALMGEFDNLDEDTDGLLINSENFQALNLMQEKYKEKVDGVYIDPPYNTGSDGFLYKDSHMHTSWLSMMYEKIVLNSKIIKDNSLVTISIDDNELFNLKYILDDVFGYDNYVSSISVINNIAGRSDSKHIARAHEYLLLYQKSEDFTSSGLELNESQLKEYKYTDKNGIYRIQGLRKRGSNSLRTDRPNMFYPLYYNMKDNSIGLLRENESDIEIIPRLSNGQEGCWRWGKETFNNKRNLIEVRIVSGRNEYDAFEKVYFEDESGIKTTKAKSFFLNAKYTTDIATTELKKILPKTIFTAPKPTGLIEDAIRISNIKNGMILDYFAGSGTTGHATIKLNREDKGNRKYMLVEMGTYFDTVTKPRIQKVIYSDNWKNGKPQDKVGISQMFKYQVLESYEDTLNNLVLKAKDGVLQFSEQAQEEYLLNYMLDMETQDHLFNIEIFQNPFDYKLNVTENNELIPTRVDLVETFNYLIGLYVNRMQRVKNNNRDIKFVEGITRDGQKTLVIWRNTEITSNEEVQSAFRKLYQGTLSREFDQIYINGDHHFRNMRLAEDRFKVNLIESEFFKRMFEEE